MSSPLENPPAIPEGAKGAEITLHALSTMERPGMAPTLTPNVSDKDLITARLTALRKKVLDLSVRNPLVSVNLKERASGTLRVVDELPDVLVHYLRNHSAMRIIGLPPLEDDPEDEKTDEFKNALADAMAERDKTLRGAKSAKPADPDDVDRDQDDQEGAPGRSREMPLWERRLRDKVREKLKLPKRPRKDDPESLARYAESLGINPSFELPHGGPDDAEIGDEEAGGNGNGIETLTVPGTGEGIGSGNGRGSASVKGAGDGSVKNDHFDRDIQTLLLPDALERKLKNMRLKNMTFQEETGLSVFFAAIGLLKWPGPKSDRTDKDDIFSPILMLPLRLEPPKNRSAGHYSVNTEGDDIRVNFVLAEILKSELGVALPPFEPDSTIDFYLDALTESLGAVKGTRLEVQRQFILGLFPYDGMAIYEDLDPSRSWYDSNPVVREVLIGLDRPDEPAGAKAPQDAAELGLVMSADSSQIRVITDLLGPNGRNLAVEGPPGTGKSQTIVNAIAHALGKGQKVLFIAEKLAALEVVKSRLESIGLGDFLLPLQANRSSRSQVFESIKRRMEAPSPPPPSPLDAGLLSRYQKTAAELNDYVAFLEENVGGGGFPIADILGRHLATSALLEPLKGVSVSPENPGDYDQLAIDDLVRLGDDCQRAARDGAKLGSWKGLRLQNLNAFTAAPPLQAAEDAARLLDDWAAKEGALREMARPFDLGALDASALNDLGQSLAELCNLGSELNPEILSSLHNGPGLKKLLSFLDAAESARNEEKSLAAIADSADPAILSLADKVLAASETYHLDLVDPAAIASKRSALAAEIEAMARDHAALAPVVNAEPRLSGIDLELVFEMGRLAARCGRAALSLRSKLPPDPALLSELKRLTALAANIKIERSRLSSLAPGVRLLPQRAAGPWPAPGASQNSGAYADACHGPGQGANPRQNPGASPCQTPGAPAYQNHGTPPLPGPSQGPILDPESDEALLVKAGIFETAGFFSFLSAGYREAKKWWRGVSGRSFDPKEAAAYIRDLLALRGQVAAFEASPVIRRLLSAPAAGGQDGSPHPASGSLRLDNGELEDYGLLIEYYESVLSAFPPITRKEACDLALAGPKEPLLAIPSERHSAAPGSFEDFDRLIAQNRARQEELAAGEAALAELGFKPKTSVTAQDLASWRERAAQNEALKKTLGSGSELAAPLGPKHQGHLTERFSLAPEVTGLMVLERAGALAPALISWAGKGGLENAKDAAASASGALASAQAKISAIAQDTGVDFWPQVATMPPEDRSAPLKEAASDRDGLFAHSALATHGMALTDLGLGDALPDLLMAAQSAPSLGRLLEAGLYKELTTKIFHDHQRRLSGFLNGGLDKARALMAQLDQNLMLAAKNKLAWKLFSEAKPPNGVGSGLKANWTEMALLNNEAQKKKALIGLRKLIPRAAKALLELKPCWMMSPTAVSQYLVGETATFDLVILDEASQMPPQNAIPSLARCRRCMIVGDQNQLPPTTFFKKALAEPEGGEDDEADPIEESILEMARGVFRPPRRLLWHYRSRHSALIEFSNQEIYDGSLVVYPSPSERRPGMGVELIQTRGLYKSGQNEIEAKAMVEFAIKFMRENPSRSLGLVTLNQKQMDLVLDLLDQAIAADPKAVQYENDWLEKNEGLERLFVKNLENVQGDERDCILIGTVYGPETPGGPVANRFGPIIGEAGRRRLNVLFSRAKERLATFTSMTPEDIKAADDDTRGVAMLKRWLRYCAKGGKTISTTTAKAASEMSLRGFAAARLAELGYAVEPSVGTDGYRLDLAIKNSGDESYSLGLETDGPLYRGTISIRDRDKLRDEVLKGLGWKLARLWTLDWVNRPAKEIERLAVKLGRPNPPAPQSPDAQSSQSGSSGATRGSPSGAKSSGAPIAGESSGAPTKAASKTPIPSGPPSSNMPPTPSPGSAAASSKTRDWSAASDDDPECDWQDITPETPDEAAPPDESLAGENPGSQAGGKKSSRADDDSDIPIGSAEWESVSSGNADKLSGDRPAGYKWVDLQKLMPDEEKEAPKAAQGAQRRPDAEEKEVSPVSERDVRNEDRLGESALDERALNEGPGGEVELDDEARGDATSFGDESDDDQEPFVEEGDVVELYFNHDPSSMKKLIVGTGSVTLDGQKLEAIRPSTPLGRAVLKSFVGDDINYPTGLITRHATVSKIIKKIKPPPKTNIMPVPEEINPSERDVYALGYKDALVAWLCAQIDEEGPIGLKYLAAIAARAHNYKRTSPKLAKHLERVLGKTRKSQVFSDERVYWPQDMEPAASIPYREFDKKKNPRPWEILSHPEKLGLAQEAIEWARSTADIEAVILYMARKLGRVAITSQARENFTRYIHLAAQALKDGA